MPEATDGIMELEEKATIPRNAPSELIYYLADPDTEPPVPMTLKVQGEAGRTLVEMKAIRAWYKAAGLVGWTGFGTQGSARAATSAPKEPAVRAPSKPPFCATCGAEMQWREQVSKKTSKPYHAWFCPKSTAEDSHPIKFPEAKKEE